MSRVEDLIQRFDAQLKPEYLQDRTPIGYSEVVSDYKSFKRLVLEVLESYSSDQVLEVSSLLDCKIQLQELRTEN